MERRYISIIGRWSPAQSLATVMAGRRASDEVALGGGVFFFSFESAVYSTAIHWLFFFHENLPKLCPRHNI